MDYNRISGLPMMGDNRTEVKESEPIDDIDVLTEEAVEENFEAVPEKAEV
jgi:hypothetical protein